MISILARSFMVATKSQSPDTRQDTDAVKRQWLPETHWWKEKPKLRTKVHLDRTFHDL